MGIMLINCDRDDIDILVCTDIDIIKGLNTGSDIDIDIDIEILFSL